MGAAPALKAMTFHLACKIGDLDKVKAHIQDGGKVSEEDEDGIQGIAYAIGANRTKVVEFLLEKGCSLKGVDRYGNTALHYAAAYGRKELCEWLVSTGLEPQVTNNSGHTPVDLALKNKQEN